jgi:hypothetical protein
MKIFFFISKNIFSRVLARNSSFLRFFQSDGGDARFAANFLQCIEFAFKIHEDKEESFLWEHKRCF